MPVREMESPKAASFQFPKGSCDTHCHVFGPTGKKHYPPDGPYQPANSPKDAMTAMLRRLGIDRVVVVQADGQPSEYASARDAIAADPLNRRGVAVIDGTFTKERLQKLHEQGFRGARFSYLPVTGGGPDPETFARVVDLIGPLGWHLVLLFKHNLPGGDLLSHAKELNALTLPFVIDHMGGVNASLGVDQPAVECLLELARKPNCWIKIAGGNRNAPPPYEESIPIAQAILAAAPDRCIWGTDFPNPYVPYPVTTEQMVDLIPRYAPDPELQHRLLVTNPARLYAFADAE